jgi:hypothetical protein
MQAKRLKDEKVEREEKWKAQREKNAIKKAERQKVERAKKARRLHRKAVKDGLSTDSGPELTASKAVDALTGVDLFPMKGKRPVKAAAGTKTPAPAKQPKGAQAKQPSSVAATAGTSTKGRIATPELLSDSAASEAEEEEEESESESSESGASESAESESESATAEEHLVDLTNEAENSELPTTGRSTVDWTASPAASPSQEIDKPSNDVINQSEEAVSQSLEEDETGLGLVEKDVPLDYGTDNSPVVGVAPPASMQQISPTRGPDTSRPQPTPTREADTSTPQPTPTRAAVTSTPQPTPTRAADTSRPQPTPTPTREDDTSMPQPTPTRDADNSLPQPTPPQGKKSSLPMAASPSLAVRTPGSKRERADIPPERSSERKRLRTSKAATVEPSATMATSTPAVLPAPPDIRSMRSRRKK